MAAPTPTLNQALDAVYTAISAMDPSPGVVLWFESDRDDPVEFVERYQDADTGELAVIQITGESAGAEEGPASGEDYEIYVVTIRLWTLQIDTEDWSRNSLHEAERIMTALDKSTSVFRIEGQVPLRTPETVALASHGKITIDEQQLFEAVIELRVEARRWG